MTTERTITQQQLINACKTLGIDPSKTSQVTLTREQIVFDECLTNEEGHKYLNNEGTGWAKQRITIQVTPPLEEETNE